MIAMRRAPSARTARPIACAEVIAGTPAPALIRRVVTSS